MGEYCITGDTHSLSCGYKLKHKQYLSKKHDKLRQVLVRLVRLQFEDLNIGLVVSKLLQKLLTARQQPLVIHYCSTLTVFVCLNQQVTAGLLAKTLAMLANNTYLIYV